VTLRSDGIELHGKLIPRSRVSRCVIENGHLVVYGDPRRTAGRAKSVPLSDIPNFLILLELLAANGFPLGDAPSYCVGS
jgi:hypothetical protein